MLKVGVTGGIGSGKTTVCRIFEVLGIPVYYADVRAKQLYREDKEVMQAVKKLFGDDIYRNGKLDRAEVAKRVFNNKELLQRLNAIVHPAVEKDFNSWSVQFRDVPFVVKEAAILFENGGYKKLDFNILVTAPEELRIKRVTKRDGISEEQVKDRIKNQWPDDKKIPLADYVIKCDEKHLVIPQVMEIVEKVKGTNRKFLK
ncbi:MAG: dephospho-CoA kinase [Chlorobi bacterium]|nr:dephospho-CoA kinase [Chlorobiota bacterium]